ncbi:hypothetical protein CXB51_029315 [Gossypium anomalum]|uniref:Uncharacterized protein n=1 Tax=Gossypium anomalum TaxID=47600 RepID=A0A8J6CPF1_9ROSI|nr:hypothetical protein CXB51_029315 [Gossypium anomalum]
MYLYIHTCVSSSSTLFLLQYPNTFLPSFQFEPSMAEAIAFNFAAELIIKLSSPALSQVGLWWNLKHDLDDLKSIVSTIKAMLLDAEEKSVTDNLIKVWLEELKDVLYDADDLLDDFSTEALRKDLLGGNKMTKEVRLFFSSSNQFAYGLKMARKFKAIKARLASIEREANTFCFIPRDRPAEASFMTKKRQETHSFEREDEIIGRDDDKAALLKLVLEFQSEENVYIIPIVGFRGLGKTALVLLVYNDEMVKSHFELTMFVCVSNVFDVKLIITNKCESHVLKLKGLSDDDAWSLFKKIAFEQRYVDSTNSTFVEVGKQILKRCGGVPLVIKTIARRNFLQEMTCKMHDLMHDLAESIGGTESSIVDSNLSVGKKLRTLLQFSNKSHQNKREKILDFIISNYRCLRVLKLDDFDFSTIPLSIHKLKHLRYLDLSDNENLKILPKSICKIQNLQVLKLDWCDGLVKLPKKIEKLVNLTHLACRGCNGLTHMPRGIGKLSSVETLSMFVVDKDGSHGGADLSELSGLNNLRGELRIRNLGFVQNAEEKFKAANLKEKQHLRYLILEWGLYSNDDDKSLEDLQPHPNLKELRIVGWSGDAKFPSWLSLLTNLVAIRIWWGNFKHLPSLAQLPCLKHLYIYDCAELEYMDDNSPKESQGNTEPFFPSLKVLLLSHCPNMQSWWRTIEASGDYSNEDGTTVTGTSAMAFPCLSYLEIENCPLTSMPLYPSLDQKLKLVKYQFKAGIQIVFLLCPLSSRVLSQIGLWLNLKDDLDDLKSTVSSIKAVLLDAEERSVTSHLVNDWLEKLKDVLYDADDLLDDFSTEALRKDLMGGNKLTKEVRLFFSSSNQFAYGLKMGQKIKAIKARLASIESEANTFGFMVRDRPVETSFMIKKRQQTHSFVSKDKIIGRNDDKAALLKLMFESEENVYIIPIVGFGGLGNTALTQFVYNDKMIYDYFELRMWVCVSDVFDVKIILENIIKSITGQAPDQNLEIDQLQKQLRDKIGGAKGSRIIVTTRSFKVAKITSKCQPLVLKGLSDDDAWCLFKEIAFEQRYADSTNSAFVEIGKQILERCSGVPLVIRTIGSTLSYKETEEQWRIYRIKGLYWVKEQACKMHDLMHDLAETVAGMESSIVDSNKIASNVGKKCRHISIKPSLIPLFKGKKLRTLLHFPSMKAQNLSDETWDLIIANCRCLRTLELNALNLMTIPRSIYKLKHLRHLDLTNNHGLKILPKSICKIQNLLVLKLDGCFQLEELPKKIENLVNLTHLAYRGCFGLTHMPRGIGKLTSLETLSRFVVDKDGSHDGADLSELSGLNNLREKLKIINLGFVKNAKEKFRAANLKEKQHLVSLVLKWNGGNDDDDKSLEDLQPHPNLKELCIRGWRGDAKFPSWLSLLTKLVDITIGGPSNFKHLPSFAKLPCLQQLKISNLTELECMDDNGPNGRQGNTEPFFPSLKVLCLEYCHNMKSWWRTTEAIGDDSNEDDTTVMGTWTKAFPCLSSLEIENCPLTSIPLYPLLDDKLKLVNISSRPLKQTMKMNITSRTPSTYTVITKIVTGAAPIKIERKQPLKVPKWTLINVERPKKLACYPSQTLLGRKGKEIDKYDFQPQHQ